jgi:hypothetical protein
MVPLYAARVQDLGTGDVVVFRCGACGHTAELPLRGHHTIRQKSYAKEPFRSPLPLGTVLKEGFERKSLRIFRSTKINFTNARL